jgi:hypothetical protein
MEVLVKDFQLMEIDEDQVLFFFLLKGRPGAEREEIGGQWRRIEESTNNILLINCTKSYKIAFWLCFYILNLS